MAATLDMGGTLIQYNDSETPDEADEQAIYSDWAAVGDDLVIAMSEAQNKYVLK